MILFLFTFLFTITGDMTPDEQAIAIRRVITRGACQVYRFNYYDLTACQDGATGKIVMWDSPWYMPDEEVCKVDGDIKLATWL
jgi:hypothetical protein